MSDEELQELEAEFKMLHDRACEALHSRRGLHYMDSH